MRNLTLIFLFFVALGTSAQKLPNKQETGLWAPNSVKIDGNAKEWGQLQAYNHAVDAFYTIANDDKNLYLIIRADKPRIIEKIMNTGITFTVYANDKKRGDDPGNVMISYPNLDVKSAGLIIMDAGAKEKSTIKIPVHPGMPIDTNDKPITKSTDSLKKVANNLFVSKANTIKVQGIKTIPDNELSIYNDQKIMVAGKFDANSTYTYELALPLSYLGFSSSGRSQISYNVKIESRLKEPKIGTQVNYVYLDHHRTDVDQDLDATTDFSGEYTLAKAP